MPGFSASLSQAVRCSLAQKFKDLRDDLRATVSNPTGAFIDALRKAVKLPAAKKTTHPEKFPEEQRATPIGTLDVIACTCISGRSRAHFGYGRIHQKNVL